MSEAEEPTDIQPGQTPTPEAPPRPARVRGRKRRAMGRWTRRFLKLLAVIIATVFITFFTVDLGTITIGGRSLKSLAENAASKFLERELTIDSLSARITPGRFVLKNLQIKGPYPGSTPFFKGDVEVDVKWWTLFSKDLYIDFRVTNWRMVVEKWPDGKAHLPRFTPKNPSGKPFPVKIRGLTVYCFGGEFLYDDHVTPWKVTAPNLNFDLVRANNLNTYLGRAEFSGGTVQIQKAEPMRADFKTRFQVDNGLVLLKHLDLLTDGAVSHIGGYVNFRSWPDQEYNIQSDVDFNRMREIFWNKATWRLSGAGHFNGVFKIAKDGKFDLSGLFNSEEAGLGIGKTEWRFPGLSGALQWTPSKFVVSHADSGFLGGRMNLVYNLGPIGAGGATGSLAADYEDVDLFRFTRQFGWTALEPQGRMHGHISMGWRNGAFEQTMQGFGSTVIAPTGGAIASPTLPASAPPIPPESPFQAFRPFGEFPLAGDVAYRFSASTLDFDNSWAATRSTYVKFRGHARGGPVNVPFQVTSHDWQNSDRLFAAIMSNFSRPVGAIPVGGRGTFDGVLTKEFKAPRIEGHFVADQMRAWGQVWGHATGDIAVENSYLTVTNGIVEHDSGGRILTTGKFAMGFPRSDGGEEIHAHIRAEHMPLKPLREAFEMYDWPLDGDLALADLNLAGEYQKPTGGGQMQIEKATAWNEPIDRATADLVFDGDGSVRLNRVEITKGPGLVTGNAWLSWTVDRFLVKADSTNLPIDQLKAFKIEKAPLSGVLSFLSAQGSGSYDDPVWQIEARVPDLYIGDEGIGPARARLAIANNVLTLEELSAASVRLQASCRGTIAMGADYASSLRCQYSRTSLDPYFKFLGRELPFTRAIASGSVTLAGPLAEPAKLAVDARVEDAAITLFRYEVLNDGPLELVLRNNVFTLQRVRFKGDKTALELTGAINLAARTSDVQARGQANLELLQVFYPELSVSEGDVDLRAALGGSFDNVQLTGTAQITNGRLRYRDAPSLSDINGPITMDAGRISVEGLTAIVGEGPVEFHGSIGLSGYKPDEFDLHAIGQSLHFTIPDGLQSTVIANLDLTGPVTAARLSGTIEVLKASYSMQIDPQQGYIGLLRGAVSTTPDAPVAAEIPTAPTFPVQLDIHVKAPLMPLVENKAANAAIVGSADVDITGTLDNPIVTGRVDLDSGHWDFSGYRYRLLGGSIDFSNPLKFDPFFDITAEADVRTPVQTYRVTVRITGTLDKLTPTLSSEPSLPEFQIMSLLLGERPDVGSAELRALSDPKQLQQQALYKASFAILTSPVSGVFGSVIQRATTLNAQIVPLLYSNDANLQQLSPGLRLILGRKISERIYLTYSRTLSGVQNDVILIEFTQNDQISWVLSRNEDRSFALDFRLRYIFK